MSRSRESQTTSQKIPLATSLSARRPGTEQPSCSAVHFSIDGLSGSAIVSFLPEMLRVLAGEGDEDVLGIDLFPSVRQRHLGEHGHHRDDLLQADGG